MFKSVLLWISQNFKIFNPVLVTTCIFIFWRLEKRFPAFIPAKRFFAQRKTNIYLGILFTLTIFVVGYVNYWVASMSASGRWGLFHQSIIASWLPLWLNLIIGFLLIDFCHYLGHLLLHKVDYLWKFHAVHHGDGHLDVSTGLRFHPGDAVFTHCLVVPILFLTGITFYSSILYGVVETVVILFIHSNLRTNTEFWKRIHPWIATPHLQAIHHSVEAEDQQSNYGIVLSIWDSFFRTLRLETFNHKRIKLGVTGIDRKTARSFLKMLFYPWN